MSLSDSCGCPAGRPLGAPHLPGCTAAAMPTVPDAQPAPNVVSIYRNPETHRPIAVPEEIVTAAEREYRAWKAHTSGKSWVEIAKLEGYEDGRAAAAAVKRYLEEAVATIQDLNRQEVIADHVGRLALMRSYVWKGVEAGKTASVAQALAIEDRWVKAFGLDQADADDAATQTVVVVESDSEYARSLRAISEQAQEPPQASAG